MMQFMSCDRNSKFSILVCCNPISLINPVPAIEVAIFHSCLQSYFTHSSILQSLFQTGSRILVPNIFPKNLFFLSTLQIVMERKKKESVSNNSPAIGATTSLQPTVTPLQHLYSMVLWPYWKKRNRDTAGHSRPAMTHRRRAQAAMQARPVMTLRNRRAGRRAQVRASRRPWWTRQGGRRWPTSRVTKKLRLGAIGSREGCLFLGIMKINLPTIKRWGTRIENCLPPRRRSSGILLRVWLIGPWFVHNSWREIFY